MTSLLKVDTENCFYRALVKIPLIKNNKTDEKNYLISIYSGATSDFIKMTIINAVLVSESYTCLITQNDYEELKNSQDLLIDFKDFSNQLKTLLTQFEENKLNMRLVADNTVKLVFYTMSDVKELVILKVPFKYTSKEDIIKYLQMRNDQLEAQCKNYLERNKALQERILEQNKQYQEIMATFERTYEEKQNLETQCSHFELECGQLRDSIDESDNKNQLLLRELQCCQNSNSNLTLSLSELRADIDSLKIGIEYYVKKTAHLQSVLVEKEKSTVPAEKYEKLNNMFCSAVADLLKCQLNLKQILSQHEFQRSENSTLKEELTNCIDMIKDLESKLKDIENNKYSPPNTHEEKYDMLSEMIRKLELQNAAKSAENLDK